jgi:signal transduction histidine kinase
LGGEITRIELCRTLNIALEELPNQLKNNIKIEKNYTCDHYVAVNPNEMVLVWSNLFQNSLQAMENGGTLRINVHQVPLENWVEVQIQDTGKGIPPENLNRIFEPFYTTRKEGEGSGLGLYLSRSVIEKYNGTISVTSQPQNTCVTVRFPIVNVELDIHKN